MIALDGSRSYDDNTDSASLFYEWYFASKPDDSQATLYDPNTPFPRFIVDAYGIYVIELRVKDEAGQTNVDRLEVSTDNLAPTAVATVDFSLVIIGDPVQFDGTASTDPEGDPLSYYWQLVTAPGKSAASLLNANTATPTLTPDLEGTYEVELTVADRAGFGQPTRVSVVGATPGEFSEEVIVSTSDSVAALPESDVTTEGNQTALGNSLTQAMEDI